MNICIDIGNTQTKVGIFQANSLVDTLLYTQLQEQDILNLLNTYPITHSIISVVGEPHPHIQTILAQSTQCLLLQANTPLPFENQYATPHTLGVDRIALAAAACHFIQQKHILVISCGTCVTFEFINRKAQYLGGAISPGLHMRLQAMHQFTQKLPLLTYKETSHFNGNSTESCMQSGAFIGIVEEIKGRIALYENEFGPLDIILSGGDCFLFEKHLKKSVFAHPYLTLFGLNKILTHNA